MRTDKDYIKMSDNAVYSLLVEDDQAYVEISQSLDRFRPQIVKAMQTGAGPDELHVMLAKQGIKMHPLQFERWIRESRLLIEAQAGCSGCFRHPHPVRLRNNRLRPRWKTEDA